MDPLAYLETLANYEQSRPAAYEAAFRLDQVRRLLVALGHPERSWAALHVAGTKGKGSTCAILAEILRAAGVRVGLYTSPHLVTVQERIQVDGQWITAGALAEAVAAVQEAAAGQRAVPALSSAPGAGRPEPPTFFEVLTAAAFWQFARQAVDVAVVEVGLGGRLDATNLVDPLVAVITPISLDHTELLGTTLEAIAREKAGIIKPGRPVVVAPQPPEVWAVIREAAARAQAPCLDVATVRTRVLAASPDGQQVAVSTPRRTYPPVTLRLLGAHQRQNLATAVLALEQLPASWAVTPDAVAAGAAAVQWPGRVQILTRRPWLIADGAHNAASAQALRDTLQEHWPGRRIHLILGCSADKDVAGIARALQPVAASVTATQARSPRAMPAPALAARIRPWFPGVELAETVREAVERATARAGAEDCVVVAGSLFVVGELLSWEAVAHG